MLPNINTNVRSLWQELTELYPPLAEIECVLETDDANLMQFMPGPPPRMYFPAEADLAIFSGLLKSRPLSCQLVAEALGATLSELTPEFLRSYIFLHECGHAYDFAMNFAHFPSVRPEQSIQRFADACMRCSERQEYELQTLPIPVTPSGFLSSRKEYPQYLEHLVATSLGKDILTDCDYGAVFEKLERAYKQLPSETIADDFAVAFIKSHSSH